MLKEIFYDSLKISKFTRIRNELFRGKVARHPKNHCGGASLGLDKGFFDKIYRTFLPWLCKIKFPQCLHQE